MLRSAGLTRLESALWRMNTSDAATPSASPIAAASRQIPIASLTISDAMRRVFQPTARRSPISPVRSNTDIAIVFVTPMPPTISASSDTIQPVEMIRRLDVSTLTACPGSVTAVTPPKRRSIAAATSLGRQPSFTVIPMVVTSRGRLASACTVGSGNTTPLSTKRSPEWKTPDDREAPRVGRDCAAECMTGSVSHHGLARRAGPAARDHHEALHRELLRIEPEDEPL